MARENPVRSSCDTRSAGGIPQRRPSRFLAMLGVPEEHLPRLERTRSGMGRPAYENMPFFRIASLEALRNRLLTDPNLRQLCGFTAVPSLATFSRRFAEFAALPVATCALNEMVSQYHEGRIVGHVSRDSTAIPAREKPVDKKRDVAMPTAPKRKRGRPRKGEMRPPKEPGRLEGQLRMKPGKALKELDTDCAWGCKKNSQGNVSFWKGYKLHLDVTDLGVPVTAVVAGANFHDSQTAIPMEKLSAGKRADTLYPCAERAVQDQDHGRTGKCTPEGLARPGADLCPRSEGNLIPASVRRPLPHGLHYRQFCRAAGRDGPVYVVGEVVPRFSPSEAESFATTSFYSL